jgi:hypothetical protein
MSFSLKCSNIYREMQSFSLDTMQLAFYSKMAESDKKSA